MRQAEITKSPNMNEVQADISQHIELQTIETIRNDINWVLASLN